MKSFDKEILEFIKKISLRIKFKFFLDNILVGLSASLFLVFFITIISLFLVFPSLYNLSLLLVILGIITSGIYAFIIMPSKERIVLIADSKGLDERVTTSLELIGKEDERSISQKKDTSNAIKHYDIRKKIPYKFNKKKIYIILSLVCISFLIGMIPTNARKEASKIIDLKNEQKEIVKKIEKEENDIDNNKELTPEEKKEIKEGLKNSRNEIKQSNSKKELNKSMERLEKKLESQKNKLDNEKKKKAIDNIDKNLLNQFRNDKRNETINDLNKLKKELEKSKEGKKLEEVIKSEDKEKIENQIKELNSLLSNLSASEESKLANALSDAAKNISDDELKAALENASEGVMNGEIDPKELAEALYSLSKGASSSAQKPNNGSGGGNSQGGNSGSGNGSGAGSGQGWNTGSKNGKETKSQNNKGEEIYIPGRKQGEDSNLTGNKNNKGNSQSIETENGFNLDGSKIGYDKVIGDYSNEALDGLDSSALPESLKNLIKNYFEGLQ